MSGFAGDASGGSLIDGGKLLTPTTDGVDIRETGDLKHFPVPDPGRIDAIVWHEGQIFLAETSPDGAVTLRELGCP